MDASQREPSSSRTTLAIIVAAALLAVALGGGLWVVGTAIGARNPDEITVTGSARTSVTSDRAVWTIAANDQADDITTAIARTNGALDSVSRFLTDGGIAADEIVLDALSTTVNYEWVNGNLTSQVSSYGAYRNLTVRTDDVELVARLSSQLGDVLEAGVIVSAHRPEFYVTTLPDLRPELLRGAVADAQTRAQAMLDVVGGSIVSIRSMRSGPFQVSTPDSVDVSDGGVYDTSTIHKTVTATVSVTFTTR